MATRALGLRADSGRFYCTADRARKHEDRTMSIRHRRYIERTAAIVGRPLLRLSNTAGGIRLTSICCALILPLIGAVPATAAPVYRAFVDIDNVSCFCNDQEFNVVGDGLVEAEATGGFNVRQGVARAKAGPGFLEAFGSAQNQGNPNPFFFPVVHTSFNASANENVDDLFFSSPPGSIVEEIPVRLNLHLEGVFGFDAANDDTQTASVSVDFTLPGPPTDGNGTNVVGGDFQIIRRDGVTTEIDREGLLADVQAVEESDESGDFERVIRIDSNIRTPEFVIPMNVPTNLGISLGISGQQSSGLGFGRLSADFEHTLSFPKNRPVFDLPPGFTANSAALGIVDNQYVVPEPATALLLGLAVICGVAARAGSHSATTSLRLVVARLLILVGLGPWLALHATAAPVYTAIAEIRNLGCFRCGDRKVIEAGDRPVEAEATGEFNGGQAEARAKAGPGFLEAFGSAENQGPQSVPTIFDARAFHEVDDLFFSSPPGSTVEELPVRLNLHLEGVFRFNAANDDLQKAYVQVEQTGYGSSNNLGYIEIIRRDGLSTDINRTGLLANVPVVGETDESVDFEPVIRIDANITTRPFVVPMNEPLEIGFAVAIGGEQWSTLGLGSLTADFGHTLSFPKDRPVFDLPPGFTANSAAFGIVDNQYVVPEPATAVAIGLAVIGGLAGRLARRKSS